MPGPPSAMIIRPLQQGGTLKITFYGAAGSVTGSMHLVESAGRRILLDCGLHQGRRAESDELNRNPGVDPGSVDMIVLSHAHIDHSGGIPTMVRRGFRGPVFCTAATRDLCALMLADSARIHESDADYVNRKHRREGEPPVEPLYTAADAAASMGLFHTIPYYTPFEIADGVRLRFIEAGHILGSAQVELVLGSGPGAETLLFSGDLGRPSMPVLRDPDIGASEPDVVLMEATYGGRLHDSAVDTASRLAEVVARTSERGGRVIIPAFSVGRTQEILYRLRLLREEGSIPPVPVFVDSPMATDATSIYRLHPECFDEEALATLEGGGSPFLFEGLHFVQGVAESKALNAMQGPSVVISASGMCEHGRILHHLSHGVGNPRNTVLIVGFMAENTLGRALSEGRDTVRIFGEPHAREAEVVVLDGFSAHADADGLFGYASSCRSASHIILVHGEPRQARELSGRLESAGIACLTATRGMEFDTRRAG